jgi:hypothetical protein
VNPLASGFFIKYYNRKIDLHTNSPAKNFRVQDKFLNLSKVNSDLDCR